MLRGQQKSWKRRWDKSGAFFFKVVAFWGYDLPRRIHMVRYPGAGLRVVCIGVLVMLAGGAQGQPATATKMKITVGRDTTFLTDPPLREDGTVDYLKVYDALLKRGVTLENNAFTGILQVGGPTRVSDKTLAATLEALGIKELPADGVYFKDLSEYLKGQGVGDDAANAVDDQVKLAIAKWDGEQYPQLAGWVKASDPQLNLVVEAVQRDHWYIPPVGSTTMVGILLPTLGMQRELARCLALRASMRVGEGKIDAAWKDALAIHRLARLASHGGTLIERLVAYANESQAVKADQAILASGKLTAAQAKACLADLQKLPPLESTADAINICERFTLLDMVMQVARGGLDKELQEVLGNGAQQNGQIFNLSDAERAQMDWDAVLRDMNGEYDLLVAGSAKATFGQRVEAGREGDKRTEQLKVLLQAGNLTPTERISVGLRANFQPSLGRAGTLYERALMLASIDQMGFALAAYHADKGSYPDTAVALVPDYITMVPLDRFTDQPLVYKATKTGAMIYSVNDDMEDNNGSDVRDARGHSDLVIRVGD
jgi:hypothetical protein